MRLTLRTMLAYLDDILDPEDAQKLAEKIEESDFASGLVHRMRSSMRRLRLPSPKLDGGGLGLDCNTVAEYLDNTLPADRVPDFEKVCLESDMHLAEVASCHQILTLVLGEPAEIDQETRERMYGVILGDGEKGAAEKGDAEGENAEGENGSPPPVEAADVEAPPVQSGAATNGMEPAAKTRPEVPDYLREGRRSRMMPLAITCLLVFILAGAILMAVRPPTGWMASADPDATGTPAPAADSPQAPATLAPVDPNAVTPSPDTPTPNTPAPNEPAPVRPTPRNLPPQPEPLPPQPEPLPPGPEPVLPVEPGPIANVDPPGPIVDPPAAANPDELAAKGPEKPPVDGGPAGVGEEVARVDLTPPVPVRPAGEVMGNFISRDQVLARYDAASDSWRRLKDRAPLHADDRLVVLPTYRAQIMFPNGAQVTAHGGTHLEIGQSDEIGVPLIRVNVGRVVVAPVGKAGVQIALDLDGRLGVVKFADVASEVAAEVQHVRSPGSNPLEVKPQRRSQLLVTAGEINWRDDGPAVPIAKGQVHVFVEDEDAVTQAASGMPQWLESKDLSDIDRRASNTLQPLVDTDRSLELILEERAEDRRVEVRSLAIRSLAQLDFFQRTVEVFGNEDLKSYWAAHFDSLQDALARGPKTAADVRSAFARIRGEDSAPLFRMLWGYTTEELSGGQDALLVKYLQFSGMDYRVLAIENLRRITHSTHFFRPEADPAKQARALQRWEQRLKAGDIVFKKPPMGGS